MVKNNAEMESKDTFFSRKKWLNCRGRLIDISQPKVMGILNVTPDSFYDGGKYNDENTIRSMVNKIIEEGADFIDVGGYSSRPGAPEVNEKEELERLTRALHIIRKESEDIIISVDTFRSTVASIVVKEYGADMINDISAGNLDNKMFDTIAELGVPYCIMHMQGTPATMQKDPQYSNLIQELFFFFSEKTNQLTKLGVKDIMIDPGFGFGKTLEHNYEILYRLDEFKIIGLPIIVGLSRKSMIYKVLEVTSEDALNGSSVVHTIALLGGANMLRVHDVKEAKECIKLVTKYRSVSNNL